MSTLLGKKAGKSINEGPMQSECFFEQSGTSLISLSYVLNFPRTVVA